jgi:hypothetical protein
MARKLVRSRDEAGLLCISLEIRGEEKARGASFILADNGVTGGMHASTFPLRKKFCADIVVLDKEEEEEEDIE